jgi:hypothetical protein
MDDIVERVAIAIAHARGLSPRTLPPDALWLYFPKDKAFAEARAAIEAMREPTDRMKSDAVDACNNISHFFTKDSAKECWGVMVDAALGELR